MTCSLLPAEGCMKKIICVLLFFISVSAPLTAEETLVFNTTTSGFPPFFIKGENDESGIMYDVMSYICNKHGVKLETVGLPKKRIEMQLDAGKLGANASAIEWVKDPDKYIFSDVIINVRDVLFSLKTHPIKFENVRDLFGKTIGIHYGYRYPLFDQYFNDGRIKTVIESNEMMMLKSTIFRRIDAAVVNETTANWIVNNNGLLKKLFVISNNEVDSYEYRVMFSKKWQNFAGVFNQELALMKQNGELNKIFEKYGQLKN